MIRYHDISYNGIWFKDKFKDNVIVLSTIPSWESGSKTKKLEVPIVIKKNVLQTIDEMNLIFREKNKQLIFKVQPDRYYIASLNADIKPTSAVKDAGLTLEFEVKGGVSYATNTKKITQSNPSEIVLKNDGTEDAFPVITIKNNSDNGFISLINETGVTALGVRESLDIDDKPLRNILIRDTAAFTERATTSPVNDISQGTLTVSKSEISLKSKGPWGNGKSWCGGLQVAAISESGAGVGDKRFYAHLQIAAETGLGSQTGMMKVMFWDSSNKVVALYDLWKDSTNQNVANISFMYGGNSLRTHKKFTFVPSKKVNQNPFSSSTHGSLDFEKIGAVLRFYWWGVPYYVTVPELANVAISKVAVFIGQYGKRDIIRDHYFTILKLKRFTAEVTNLDVQKGLKNPFLEGQEVSIDMATHKITLDGNPRADLFVRGGDFLKIPPGTTKLLIGKSDWCSGIDVTVEFREVYQ